jgi:hypothetical protein
MNSSVIINIPTNYSEDTHSSFSNLTNGFYTVGYGLVGVTTFLLSKATDIVVTSSEKIFVKVGLKTGILQRFRKKSGDLENQDESWYVLGTRGEVSKLDTEMTIIDMNHVM